MKKIFLIFFILIPLMSLVLAIICSEITSILINTTSKTIPVKMYCDRRNPLDKPMCIETKGYEFSYTINDNDSSLILEYMDRAKMEYQIVNIRTDINSTGDSIFIYKLKNDKDERAQLVLGARYANMFTVLDSIGMTFEIGDTLTYIDTSFNYVNYSTLQECDTTFKECETPKERNIKKEFYLAFDYSLSAPKLITFETENDSTTSDTLLISSYFIHDDGSIRLDFLDGSFIEYNDKSCYRTTNNLLEQPIGIVLRADTSKYYSGTGVGISGNTLITNRHVIFPNGSVPKSVSIYQNGEKIITEDLTYLGDPDTFDIVALHTINPVFDACPLSKKFPELKDKIYVWGFPKIEIFGENLKVTSGIVNSVNGFNENPDYFQIDAVMEEGNSGGPISQEKEILGIASMKSGSVGWGIKATKINEYLKKLGVKNKPNTSDFEKCTYLIVVEY